jgi:hypothetical protein
MRMSISCLPWQISAAARDKILLLCKIPDDENNSRVQYHGTVTSARNSLFQCSVFLLLQKTKVI